MTHITLETASARDLIVAVGRSLFERGYTAGSTGNISLRLSDGTMLMTPTNASLGQLDSQRLSHLDGQGHHLSGDRPTKEAFLHMAIYHQRKEAMAVIHLHSTYSVAVSILADLDPVNVLPALTPYYVMRVGKLPLIPYFAPGDPELAVAIKQQAANHHAMLLANHGPVVCGSSLYEAQYAIEELEETAKLYLLLRGLPIRSLTSGQIEAIGKPIQSNCLEQVATNLRG